MNSPDSDGVAREMHQSGMSFLDSAVEELTDGMGRRAVDQVSDFEDRVEAGEDYKIRVTATHAVLIMFTKRFPKAEFTFHSERNRVPGATSLDVEMNPLEMLYAEFTIDFSPYGTMFPGGGSDDDGGNSTQAFGKTGEDVMADKLVHAGINTENTPSGPSAPGNHSPSGITV